MITSEKTRVILNGKIHECDEVNISFKKKGHPIVHLIDEKSDITAELLDIDVVHENLHLKNKDTISWAQIVVKN